MAIINFCWRMLLVVAILFRFEHATTLKLASEGDLLMKTQLITTNIKEGFPLLAVCYIINNTQEDIAINIAHLDRKKALAFRSLNCKIIANSQRILTYYPYCIASTVATPLTLRILPARDTIYINTFLAPGIFQEKFVGRKIARYSMLPRGQYEFFCTFNNYGMSSYDTLSQIVLHSDTVTFFVDSVANREHKTMQQLLPYMNDFYGFLEEMIIPEDVPGAIKVIDNLRFIDPFWKIYADYIFISMHSWTHDEAKLSIGIDEAKKFIKDYPKSRLCEEIEFLLVTMLYRKSGKSEEFYTAARDVLQKYPKNINRYGVEELLEEK